MEYKWESEEMMTITIPDEVHWAQKKEQGDGTMVVGSGKAPG
jgi:hypothetical protein